LLLRARELEKGGFWDRTRFERASTLDPDNAAARAALSSTPAGSAGLDTAPRYLLAITVSVLALGGAFWVLWTARKRA
jgi:hypothetical protein